MTEKKRMFVKRLTSVIMVAVMCIAVIPIGIFMPEAKAADVTTYTVEITVKLENEGGSINEYTGESSFNKSKDNNNKAGISLFYKTDNGNGTEYEVYWDVGNSGKKYGQASGTDATVYSHGFYIDTDTNSHTCKAVLPGFPTRVFACLDYNNAFTKAVYKITQIKVYTNSKTQILWNGTGYLNSSTKQKYINIYPDTSDNGGNDSSNAYVNTDNDYKNVWRNNMPYVSTAQTISGASSVTFDSTSSKNETYSASGTATDQYGVKWTNGVTWSVSNDSGTSGNTSVSGSKVTFKNADTDYKATVKLTYPDANTSETDTSVTKTVTVNVWHKITVVLNGGSFNGSTATTYVYGNTGTVLTVDPVKTGYSHTASITSGTGTASVYNNATEKLTVKNGTCTVTFTWSANKYTLSYNGNGGTPSAESKEVTYDSAIGAMATAEREGYDFAGWFTESSDGTQWSAATTYKVADNSVVYAHWGVNNNAVKADTAVIGYAIATDINVTANDLAKGTVKGIGGRLSTPSAAVPSDFSNSYSIAGFGTFTVSGNSVRFTPTGFIGSAQTVYVAIQAEGKIIYSGLTVMPANSVYYEDDAVDGGFISYVNGVSADGSTGTWSKTGSSSTKNAVHTLGSEVYGYRGAYLSCGTYSMNAASYVKISAKNNPNPSFSGADNCSWPYARFEFTGTGFDVISILSNKCGAVEVKVYEGSYSSVPGQSVSPKYDWIADSYYTCIYNESTEKWEITDEGTAAVLYQIPVIGKIDLDYSTYTVFIIPQYAKIFDHNKSGNYEFYLDAIRIYDPTGVSSGFTDNKIIGDKYKTDGEFAVQEKSFYDMTFDPDSTVSKEGAVFINANETAITLEEAKKAAPKNELYLRNGQAVTFGIVADTIPSSVKISVHAPGGAAAKMRISGQSSYSGEITVSSATILYYEIPSGCLSWTEKDGRYVASDITVTSIGSGILSLCNLKVSYNDMPAAAFSMCALGGETVSSAMYSAKKMTALSDSDPGYFDISDFEFEDVINEPEQGEPVVIRIKTSGDAEKLVVDETDAKLVEVNADGSKTWEYILETEDLLGEITITATAFDSGDNRSDEICITVTVKEKVTEEPASEEPASEEPSTEEPSTEEPASEEPATEEPSAEEPTTEKPSDNKEESKFAHFVNKLREFIKKVFELIKNMIR